VVLVQLCLGISLAASRADEQSDAIQSFLETYSSQRDQYELDMAAVDLRDLNAGLDGSKVRYQHINLPWPIKDGH